MSLNYPQNNARLNILIPKMINCHFREHKIYSRKVKIAIEETFAVSSLYFKCQQVCLLPFPFSLYPARDNFTISTYSLSWAQGTREGIERQLSLPHYDLLLSYLPEKP